MKSYTYGAQGIMDFMGIAKSVYRFTVERMQPLSMTTAKHEHYRGKHNQEEFPV
jgi:hypothetical protein